MGEGGEVRVPCSVLAHSSSGEQEGKPHMGCESGLNSNCPKGPEKLMGLGEEGREHTVTSINKPCQWLYQQERSGMASGAPESSGGALAQV